MILKTIAKFLLKEEINELKEEIQLATKKNILLTEQLNYKLKAQEKEIYYNHKYPKKNIAYRRTDKNGENLIDVRQFLNKNNYMFPKFEGTEDEKALACLKYVIKNIKYVPDKNQYKKSEYWAFGYETFNSKEGDCEDGSILLYDLMRYNQIPSWKLRVTAGYVKSNDSKSGHAYLNYYCQETDQWVVLDWCYWPNLNEIKNRKDYKDEKKYLDVWFSFNEDCAWSIGLNTEAQEVFK